MTAPNVSTKLLRSLLCLTAFAAGCAGLASSVEDPNAPPALSDAEAVLAQELGNMPAPQGPCPERTQANVLTDPRAAVRRTGFGLAYCMLKEGPEGGLAPRPTDTVRVHYTGWTPEGEVFDTSEGRGPTEFPLNGVIRGWTEGLQLMRPGDKARFWIPGNMAYGTREPGEPAGQPPTGTLIFEIELLEVVGGPSAGE